MSQLLPFSARAALSRGYRQMSRVKMDRSRVGGQAMDSRSQQRTLDMLELHQKILSATIEVLERGQSGPAGKK